MSQFTVQLNNKDAKVVEKLAEKQQISQRQVVRKAIALYQLYVETDKVTVAESDSPGCGSEDADLVLGDGDRN